MNEPLRILSFHLLNVIFNSSQVCEYAVTQMLDYYSREDEYNHPNKTEAHEEGIIRKKTQLFCKLKLTMNVQHYLVPKKPQRPTVAEELAFLLAFVLPFVLIALA